MSPLRGPNNQSYNEFFLKWSEKQQEIGDELSQALRDSAPENKLKQLVQKAEKHYEQYYHVKDGAAKQDVLKVLNPTWKTPLENAFMWIGGWRPSMLFQLAYAQAGRQVEAELADFLDGLDTPNMASLSGKQLSDMSKLQIRTQQAEDDLGYRQAIIQQSLVDHPLSALAHASSQEDNNGDNGLRDVVDAKVKAQEDLLVCADDLRINSLKEFLSILSTTQAAQYLVTAGQLHSAVRKIGLERQQKETCEQAD